MIPRSLPPPPPQVRRLFFFFLPPLLLLLLLLRRSAAADLPPSSCSPTNCGLLRNLSYPFGPSSSHCGASPSFHLSDCNNNTSSSSSLPSWNALSDCSLHPSACTHPSKPPFVTSIYDQPSGLPTLQGIPDQLGPSNRPFAFLNLTWLPPDQISRPFCLPFPAQNLSQFLPPAINLTDFALSTFRFSSYSIFLLFNCSNWTADSKARLDLGASDNSSFCQAYQRYCPAGNVSTGPGGTAGACVQITPWKVLMLQDIVANLSCTHFSFFVDVHNLTITSLPTTANSSNNTKALLQLTFSHSTLSSEANCEDCVRSNGSCGFDDSNSFMCFCPSNMTSTSKVCVPSANPPPPAAAAYGSSSSSSKTMTVVLALSIVVLGSVSLGAGIAVLWWFCRRNKWSPIVVTASSSPSKKKLWTSQRAISLAARRHHISKLCKEFSLEELMRATHSFADETMVADGGFAAVYLGFLKDGRRVAVKRFYHDNYKRLEHFYNEVRTLSNLDHPNLVKLYGFCCQDERDLLLVYEYAANGSVADQLHNMEKPAMPWRMRLNIAWETADALSYLHNSVSPPIYHRDVKTANILLDDMFHVKLADFGLSRYVPLNVTHISTMPQGTPGYVDPDYHQSYQLTDKSDVYSFGVVLVELISAKPAVDVTRAKGEVNLSTWAVTKIACEAWEELIDPRLERDSYMERAVKTMGELAFLCLQHERDDRPTMHHVADALSHLCKWYDKMRHLETDLAIVKKAKVVAQDQKPSSSSLSSDGQDASSIIHGNSELKDRLLFIDDINYDSCSTSTTASTTITRTNRNSSFDNNASCTQKLLQPNSFASSPSSTSFSSNPSNL